MIDIAFVLTTLLCTRRSLCLQHHLPYLGSFQYNGCLRCEDAQEVQYTTTIHVLNSAIIKLSREQQVVHAIDITNIANTHAFHSRFYEIQACRVYRGVSGGE